MKASFMRAVDWYVGLPICMALAAGRVLVRPRARPSGNPRTVLVIKFLGAGSICLAAPMLRATRDLYPSARVHFLTFAENAAAVRLLGLVDEVHTVRRDRLGAFVRDTLHVIRRLRRERIDLALDLEFFAKYPLIFCALAKVRRIAGFYLTLEPWLRRLLDVHGYYNHYFHVKDIFLSLLYRAHTGDSYYLGFDDYVRRYPQVRLPVAEADREAVRAALRRHGWSGQRLIAINPNAGRDVSPELRKWPPDRFRPADRRRPRALLAGHGRADRRPRRAQGRG
jgi:ADP-heptose:LPS heptosyltransferase